MTNIENNLVNLNERRKSAEWYFRHADRVNRHEAAKKRGKRALKIGFAAGLTALIGFNGGPGRVMHNIKTFPAHMEWVLGDRNPHKQSDSGAEKNSQKVSQELIHQYESQDQ